MTDMSDKPAPGVDYSAASADIHPGTGADYVERQAGASVVNERDFVDIPSGAQTDCATNTLVASFVNEKELGAIRAHQEETYVNIACLPGRTSALLVTTLASLDDFGFSNRCPSYVCAG